MKTVFITGASSGFGYKMALTFARRGYKVYATTLDFLSNSIGLKKKDVNISSDDGYGCYDFFRKEISSVVMGGCCRYYSFIWENK